ncbi:HdeD family acid-resistance protein [Caulobacter sp. 17J80-11]|uniref:HdeD family acid-resistance protein n=1 Tax=Caulobacter sp. 17J80-11 TaxID=2763502 RepID=UPI0016539A3A|nr:DUF308 domain-containing protein [Caulobacter sp. 17J80-11]MBC6980447.1 DUF308 domain-containing protein [Caulobacter sp. 17J80-11]
MAAPPRWTFGVVSALYGVCLMVLGALALTAPLVSSIAVALFLGAILAAAGVLGAVAAVRDRKHPGFGTKLAWALLSFVMGLWLLGRPVVGAASVTLALAIFFLIRGLLTVVFALKRRATLKGWLWPLLSGLATMLLGGVVLAGWPGASLIALGIIVGVDLIFLGAALVAAAFMIGPERR